MQSPLLIHEHPDCGCNRKPADFSVASGRVKGVVALIAELFHTHRNQRIVRHAMGQVLVNALIGQVESQYGTCPVTGLRGNLGILFPPGLRFTRPELLS